MASRANRGGIRQRLARIGASESQSAAAPSPDDTGSHLANFLVREFLWGHITAPTVQKIVMASVSDYEARNIAPPRDIQLLAEMGGREARPGDINKQIRQRFRAKVQICEPSSFGISLLRRPGAFAAYLAQCSIMLPHILFSCLYHKFPSLFKDLIVDGRDTLRAFWRSQRANPQLVNHPIVENPEDYRCSAVPIALHGDGVVMVGLGRKWARASDVLSWRSLVATNEKPTNANFLIWSVWTSIVSKLFGQRTKRQAWKIIAWSLNALQKGKWPTHDHLGQEYVIGLDKRRAGTPLCGYGEDFRCAVVWVLAADLDFMRSEYLLPNSQNKETPCPYCSASGSDGTPAGMRVYEFRPTHCLWKAAMTTKATWCKGPAPTFPPKTMHLRVFPRPPLRRGL